ncbi:MAG: hypothetical protein RBT69_08995 [Spirochaetia bacterium]|jgi:hypothetical protein|nr:hypothetical protein [Spirochaetia bacterium]
MEIQALNLKYITNSKGEKTEVILPIEEFYELLEDLEDLAVVAQRRNEETFTLEEVEKELGL